MKSLKLLLIFLSFSFFINDTVLFSQSFETGKMGVIVNNFGRFRIYSDSLAGLRQIERFSLLAGVNSNEVFDYFNDAESVDSAITVENPEISDFEIYVKTDNSYSGAKPDVNLIMNVYGWDSTKYALLKYSFISKETEQTEYQFGYEHLPIVDGAYGFESVKFNLQDKIMYHFLFDGTNYTTHTGIKVLSYEINSLTIFDWYDGYNSSDQELFNWLNYGSIDTLYDASADGTVVIGAYGTPISMAAEDTVIIYMAAAIGSDYQELSENISLAEEKYLNIVTSFKNNDKVPTDFALQQNFPNPFNPSTTIKFSLPEKEFVTLKVYNVLGKEVANLISEELNSGVYEYSFDGSSLSSGVYFYKLSTNKSSVSKKMTLIK